MCDSSFQGDISVSHTKTLETPKEELTTGYTFAGRYQIIEELGKGGIGRVYKVFDKKIKEKIALKLIKPEIASAKRVEEWGKWMRDELVLDVPHRQVVFTLPKMLRVFFKYNRKLL